jgi:hypothetical protein
VIAYLNGHPVRVRWTVHGRTITLLLRRGVYRLRIVVKVRVHGHVRRLYATRRYRTCNRQH